MAKRKPKRTAKKKPRDKKHQQTSHKYSLAEWCGFGDDPDPRWVEFSRKHAGNPALKHDAICALPESFIKAIELEMPDFFSGEEQEFERDLARLSGVGFFLGHSYGYPPLRESCPEDNTDEESRVVLQRQREADQQIKQMLAEDMEQRGRSSLRIQQHFATRDEIAEKIEARKWGYVGWLVTNPEFRKEWAEVRKAWEPRIREIGGFPVYPTDFLGRSPIVPKGIRDFYDDYTRFYQRWCIHTFANWDLPIPMWAGIATPSFYPLAQVSEAGMALFIPWYLLRDQKFKLQDLTKHERFSKGPDHLEGWFNRNRSRWGHDRLGKMLKVYVLVELCLKARYPDRINKRTEKLDYSLSRFLFQSPDTKGAPIGKVDSIKKIRQEMARRLKT